MALCTSFALAAFHLSAKLVPNAGPWQEKAAWAKKSAADRKADSVKSRQIRVLNRGFSRKIHRLEPRLPVEKTMRCAGEI
jgi:hypothetical protein